MSAAALAIVIVLALGHGAAASAGPDDIAPLLKALDGRAGT